MSEDARQITYVRDQHLAWSTKLSSFAVDAGTYEFLFNIPLEGALLETITGPKHQYHTYQVEAIVERKYMSDLHMAQPLRVYKFSPELECHYLTSFENQVCAQTLFCTMEPLLICLAVHRRPQPSKHLLPHRPPNNNHPVRLLLPRAVYIPCPIQRHHPNHPNTLHNREALPPNSSHSSTISAT